MMASAVRRGASAGWKTCPVNRFVRVGPRSRCRRSRSCLYAQLQPQLRAADSSDSASGSANITSTQAPRGSPPPAPGGSGGGDPEEEEPGSGSLQIGFDAFTQQLLLAAVTGGAAAAIAFLGHVDLRSSLRLELDALSLAVELCAPVLVLLLVMCAPRWAPPFQGSELARLQHNHYLTAQVLQLYDVLDDDDEEEEEDKQQKDNKKQGHMQQSSAGAGAGAGPAAGSSRGDGGANGRAGSSGAEATGERARVRRRLRLEQTLGWGTVSSALALVQAYTLQPWNPPTPNTLLGAALAGRGVRQLANEVLWRGAVWGLLAGGVGQLLAHSDASDGLLFLGRVFGGEDAAMYIAGLGLVALSLPGALWEARNLRNFVRASVVGPVRDAAIFCTGDGVNQPAYCDPRGYALLAARRPANAASVADVVTRTRAWVQGPDQSYGSMDSMDLAEGVDRDRSATTTTATAAAGAAAAAGSDGKSNSNSNITTTTSSPPASPSAASSAAAGLGRAVGARVQASSAAFEADSRDMGVLLSVETLQDKLAFWSALYFQLLSSFAINGSFLASDGNLLASLAAAVLLRTGPLMLAELRARTAAAAESGGGSEGGGGK